MVAATVEEEVGGLEEGQAQGEGTREAGHLPRTEAVLRKSGPQGCRCLPRPPAVLLSSAWTKLSTATLLASNRLWPSSAAAKEMGLHLGGTQGPKLGLPKPLKDRRRLGPQPGMTLRGPTATVSLPTPTLRSRGRW